MHPAALLLLAAQLGLARAEPPAPAAPTLRLKLTQGVAQAAVITGSTTAGPAAADRSVKLRSLDLSTGPTRVELTYRLTPRWELGGLAGAEWTRVGFGESGPYDALFGTVGVTAAHTAPLGPRVAAFGQARLAVGGGRVETNAAPATSGETSLQGALGAGLRLRLAERVTLDPAVVGAAGGIWRGEGAPSRTTSVGGELGLSFCF
jgi:hypothetical protein